MALIETRIADHVCTILLNRPEKRNALNSEMIDAFHAAVRDAAGRRDARVVVVAAAGQTFCAGLDLRELAAQRESGRVETHTLEEALEALERCSHPTIAAVQGDAVAGGCELALHCDLRVAGDSARFAMPLARIGIAVPVALTWKLVDTIGAAATKELLFTGDAVGAETALALGLVNRVVATADLGQAVDDLARQVAHNAPLSVRAMKAFVQRATEERRTWRRDDLLELFHGVQASADAREGLAAQRERRPPVFRGE
ncbi:MAG TPA: enoyl-CoA hydratase/isomerase family protein [Candidatus Binatia bacterium]|nr:enoyl-CoA hydratase/isomerase family protein [Candidatus Binatia bacterium]